jgi:hypothetical protein
MGASPARPHGPKHRHLPLLAHRGPPGQNDRKRCKNRKLRHPTGATARKRPTGATAPKKMQKPEAPPAPRALQAGKDAKTGSSARPTGATARKRCKNRKLRPPHGRYSPKKMQKPEAPPAPRALQPKKVAKTGSSARPHGRTDGPPWIGRRSISETHVFSSPKAGSTSKAVLRSEPVSTVRDLSGS